MTKAMIRTTMFELNVIELRAGDLVDRCTWLRRGHEAGKEVVGEKVNM